MKRKVCLVVGCVAVIYAVVNTVVCIVLWTGDPGLMGIAIGLIVKGIIIGYVGLYLLKKAIGMIKHREGV